MNIDTITNTILFYKHEAVNRAIAGTLKRVLQKLKTKELTETWLKEEISIFDDTPINKGEGNGKKNPTTNP